MDLNVIACDKPCASVFMSRDVCVKLVKLRWTLLADTLGEGRNQTIIEMTKLTICDPGPQNLKKS